MENVKVGLRGEVFDSASKLGFLVFSCLFGLGSQDGDCLANVCFLGEGASDHCCCCKHPTYKLPIASNMSFFGVKSKNGC